MRTSRIFWSLLLLFLSLTAAARAQGDRDSLAAATTDPLTVQTAGGNSLAAVEQVWDAANTGLYQFGLSSGDRCLPAVDPAGLCVR